MEYGDLAAQNVDASVKTDARITATTGSFPAGARIFKVTYNGTPVPGFTPYVVGSEQSELLLSTVLGTTPTSLLGHNGQAIGWELYIDGINTAVAVPVKVEAIAYVDYGNCYAVLDDDEFTINFAPATFAITGVNTTVCHTEKLEFNAAITYPAISNLNPAIMTDALITSTASLDAGSLIEWDYNGLASGSYTLPAAATSIRLSQITGMLAPLQGHSGTDTWNLKISNTNDPLTFNLTIEPLAWLEGSDYFYAEEDIDLVVNTCGSLNGWVKYNNLPLTPMNKVTVELKQDGTTVKSTETLDNTGAYSFTDVPYGEYDVVFTTQKEPGSINSTDAGLVNQWASQASKIQMVTFLSGDVEGNNNINATDAYAIQNKFVNLLVFNTKWVFWIAGETINANPTPPLSALKVNLISGASTVNFYGMATGDFNGSLIPTTAKSASIPIQMVYGDEKMIGAGQEFTLPVRLVKGSAVGAVSLIMNIPSDLVSVEDVMLPEKNGQLTWAIKGNELRIGWNSLKALNLSDGDVLLTLKMKASDRFTSGNSFRITVSSDPLNELADDKFMPIPDVKLSTEVFIASAVTSSGVIPEGNDLIFSNYPNPFHEYTMIKYGIPYSGKVMLTIHGVLGNTIETLVDEVQPGGEYTVRYNSARLVPGMYTARIVLENNGETLVRTIKMINK